MRVLLVHPIEEVILFAYHGLEIFARYVFTFAAPQHSHHSRQGSNDVALRLVCTVEVASISVRSKIKFRIVSPVHVFFIFIIQKILRQRTGVAQTLNYAVHVAGVSEIL